MNVNPVCVPFMSVFLPCPCSFHVRVPPMSMFLPCPCSFHVRVPFMSVFLPCPCSFHVRVPSMSVFLPCPCSFHVRVPSMSVFLPCPCSFHVRVPFMSVFLPYLCLLAFKDNGYIDLWKELHCHEATMCFWQISKKCPQAMKGWTPARNANNKSSSTQFIIHSIHFIIYFGEYSNCNYHIIES